MDIFETNTMDVVNDVLVIRYLDLIKTDCLELAVRSGCSKILSHKVAVRALNKISKSDATKTENDLVSIILIIKTADNNK